MLANEGVCLRPQHTHNLLVLVFLHTSWNIVKELCFLLLTELGILIMRFRARFTLRFGIVLWVLVQERGFGISFFKIQLWPVGK